MNKTRLEQMQSIVDEYGQLHEASCGVHNEDDGECNCAISDLIRELSAFLTPSVDVEKIKQEFEDFLGNEFDYNNKKDKRETHRWLFCWNGEQDDEMPFDCACCMGTPEALKGLKCGCICHKRIDEIFNFFLERLQPYLQSHSVDVEKCACHCHEGNEHLGTEWTMKPKHTKTIYCEACKRGENCIHCQPKGQESEEK